MTTKKTSRRALLTSVMALVMCLVMLVGTTFAWFTDSVTSGVNTIKSGNLDVKLTYVKGTETGEVTKDTHLFNDAALWEPGHVEYVVLTASNEGTLALKYKLAVNVFGETGSVNMLGDAFQLSSYLQYAVIDGDATTAADFNRDTLTANPGTVLGSYTSDETALYPAGTEGQISSKTVTLAVWMPTTVGNEANHKTGEAAPTIQLGVSLVATQKDHEEDSFGNDYDKNVDVVAVTPDTIATVDFTKSNAVYQFAAGSYSGTTLTVRDNTNTVFEAAAGATFDNVTIKYAANRYGVTDKSDSTMTIKGFNVTGVLDVNCADGKLIVENNTAKKIKVIMNRMDGKENADIQIKNNVLNGGNYGIELVPNHSGYALTISGNEFTNITSNAISVMGYQSDLNASDATRTAAASITVSGNTFNSYGAGKAAFKIWGDTNLAPNGTDALTEAAQALADSVKANNTFGTGLDSTCVVADFFGQKVNFN